MTLQPPLRDCSTNAELWFHGMASPPSFFFSFPLPSHAPSFCSSPTLSNTLRLSSASLHTNATSAKSAKMLSCSGPNKLDLETLETLVTLELIAHFITCQSVFFLSILQLFMYYCMFYFCIYVAMTPQHKHFFWPCKANPTNKDC